MLPCILQTLCGCLCSRAVVSGAEAEGGAAQAGRRSHAARLRVDADLDDLLGIVRAAESRRTVPLGGEFEVQSKSAVANSLAAALDTARCAYASCGNGATATAAGEATDADEKNAMQGAAAAAGTNGELLFP